MKVLIIEDEPAAARRLSKMLLEIEPAAQILACLDSVEQSLAWLADNPPPDLILMDIQLADGHSFEIFRHLDVESPVIFTTAYDEYALQAFRVHALDYLLKPIKRDELDQAIQRLRPRMERGVRLQWNQRFVIRTGPNLRVVELREAAWFYTENKIAWLVARSGKRYALDHTLEKLEEMLPPEQYFRINRQMIVFIGAIQEMHTVSKSRLKLRLEPAADMDAVVSAERSPAFRKWLAGE
jgi:two-component system, LytTR family, response regulator LytT